MICSSFFHVQNFVKFCNVFANWLHIFAISLVKQQQTFAKSLHNFCKIIEICKDFANLLQRLCNILREFIAKYLQAGCKHFAKAISINIISWKYYTFSTFCKDLHSALWNCCKKMHHCLQRNCKLISKNEATISRR